MGSIASISQCLKLRNDKIKGNNDYDTESNIYTIEKLKEEMKYVKKVNTTLEHQLNIYKYNDVIGKQNMISTDTINMSDFRRISELKIQEFADSIIQDSKTNISWLPDIVERQIYINITRIGLNMLEMLLRNTLRNDYSK